MIEVLLHIFGYLGVGSLFARYTFIRCLGTDPEDNIESATAWALASVFLWPFAPCALVARWIFSPTPHEKRVAKQEELKKLESEMKRLEREYNLDFRK